MFLKQIEISGFKSFADKTVIRFDEDITGIVGPNGCGKSNITDAIRWVLGEQSAKSLRSGTSMTDIIFSGSQSRKPVNLARVSLLFDNSAKIFNSPFEEIEITREVRRSTQESVCYINKTPCRLKDITDLVMDTGLGRDSLSIITQGNISSFADAKPEERRLLFEEAAGVAKYKKRKKTSLAKLENVKSNLERVQDLLDTLEEQKESLKEQAETAKAYMALKEQLASIETGLLAARIQKAKQSETDALLQKANMQTLLLENSKKLENLEQARSGLNEQSFALDQKIARLQTNSAALLELFYKMQKQKVELDEKRRYLLEQGDLQEKQNSISALLKQAQFEYQDRYGRLQAAKEHEKILDTNHQNIAFDLMKTEQALQQASREHSSLQNRISVLEGRIKQSSWKQPGVHAILQAKNALYGIEGLVKDLIVPEENMELAISTALAGSSDQIVTIDDQAAMQAISYLKQNRAGRATFLPLSACKARTLQPWQQNLAMSMPGILGTADQFAACKDKYDALRGRLLGGILVAQTLKEANAAAKALKQSVKIVTVEGDVIHAGGAMTGGQSRSNSSAALLEQKKQLEKELGEIYQKTDSLQQQKISLLQARDNLDAQILQVKIDVEKLAQYANAKKEKLEDLQLQAKALLQGQEASESEIDDLTVELAKVQKQRDETESELKLCQTRRAEITQSLQENEKESADLRKAQSEAISKNSALEVEIAKAQTSMEQDLQRLGSEYAMTYEAAAAVPFDMDFKEAQTRSKSLRRQLAAFGSVNMQAPEQYDQVLEKYDFLQSQKEELEEASRLILDAVDQMDQTMTEQFSTMFEKINGQLDGVFKAMFGGGNARLSLSDPSDVLHSGIEVDVQPPGKAVKNLSTFSGGEKALIAISVLFAILKARTVPLCIFDEVEAALDQANVERFAKYLGHFKDQSQFIVVTHRPGTMEQCQSLYGITMQKDGVSMVLKVKLQQALESAGARKSLSQ
jgi:chromosome segregation protein